MDGVLRPYEGYLHVVPRLTALLERVVPISSAPLVANVAAVGIAVAVAGYVASGRLALVVPDSRVRLALGALVLFLPGAAELQGSITLGSGTWRSSSSPQRLHQRRPRAWVEQSSSWGWALRLSTLLGGREMGSMASGNGFMRLGGGRRSARFSLGLEPRDSGRRFDGRRDPRRRSSCAAPSLVLVSDNAHATSALRDVCSSLGIDYRFYRERPEGHFYPGGSIGLGVLERASLSA
jgi:hypothetical protein